MKNENIILLHGALGSKIQFQVLKNLLSSQFNVLDLNFEGHGDRFSNKEYSIDLFVENVQEKLNEINITETNIFGYSMGGYVGLKLALTKPELVKRIVTLGTKFDWNKEIVKQEVEKLNPEKIEEKVPAFANRLAELHSANNWKSVVRKTADLMEGLGNGKNLTDTDLKQINHKILIGIGAFDNMVTLEESKQALESLQNGNLLVLEGCKHPIESVNMYQLSEIISNFIAEI